MHRLLLLSAAFCCRAFADDAAAAAPTAAEAQRLELMQSFEYSDEQQCHAVIQAGAAPRPVLNLLVAAYGLPDSDKDKIITALEAALARGCEVNALGASGLSPLHEAVLFNDEALVRFLLAHGADVRQSIRRPGSPVDGMDAAAFLDWILLSSAEKGDLRDRSGVQAALSQTAQ